MAPVALDLPGPSRRIRVEPLAPPVPAPPAVEPAEPARDPVEPAPGPAEPVRAPDAPVEEPARARARALALRAA